MMIVRRIYFGFLGFCYCCGHRINFGMMTALIVRVSTVSYVPGTPTGSLFILLIRVRSPSGTNARRN